MKCLTDTQLAELTACAKTESRDAGSADPILRHIADCAICREKLESLRRDAGLIDDLRELHASRSAIDGLVRDLHDKLSSVDPTSR